MKNKAERRRVVKENFSIIINGFIGEFTRDIKDQLKGKKIKILFIGIILYILFLLTKNDLIKTTSLTLIIFSSSAIIFYLVKKYTLKLIVFLRFIT